MSGKVYYRERRFLDKYRCIDRIESFRFQDYFTTKGTSVVYFKIDRFNVKVISIEDIVELITE